ncbi:MAG: cytochrome c oxidase assembly protein [Alphaproteobacteria bacterium]
MSAPEPRNGPPAAVPPAARPRRSNATIALPLFGIVAGMGMMAYAAVPLYQLFCQVTGFGGTTQVAKAASDTVLDREVVIRFNADVNPALPWSFQPEQREVRLKVGEQGLAFYRATNTSSKPVMGTATYNVTPQKVGLYFNKIQCFCFTEQVLEPGESMDMPVTFFVDPAIAEDRNLDDVRTITLSYTFYRTSAPEPVAAQSAQAVSANGGG